MVVIRVFRGRGKQNEHFEWAVGWTLSVWRAGLNQPVIGRVACGETGSSLSPLKATG